MGLSNYVPNSRLAQPGVCTSTTRPATPYEGQVIYETDTNRVLVWDASAWVMIADTDQPPGLQLVKTATFTGITSSSTLDITDVFSTEFDNYRVIIRSAQTSADGNLFFRFRTASAVEQTAVYNYAAYGSYVGSGPTYNFASYGVTNPFSPDIGFFIGRAGNGYSVTAELDIFSPNKNRATRLSGSSYSDYTGTYYNTALQLLGEVSIATQFTGLRFYPTTGTAAGEYQIYGYRI